MGITIKGATIVPDRAKPQEGRHVCKLKDVRYKSGYKGEGIWFDFIVVDGPSPKNFEFSTAVYPNNARPSGNMTYDQAKAKEQGKIVKYLGAVLGYSGNDVFRITQEVLDAAIARPVSPHSGRLVVVNVVSHVNLKGQNTVYYQLFPVDAEQQAPFPLSEVPVEAAAPAAPPPPPAAFPPPGWAPHPTAPGYFYCGNLVKLESELRAM